VLLDSPEVAAPSTRCTDGAFSSADYLLDNLAIVAIICFLQFNCVCIGVRKRVAGSRFTPSKPCSKEKRQIFMRALRFNLDALGVCASTLCMIHCLVLPLLLAALPMWSLSANVAKMGVEEQTPTAEAQAGIVPESAIPCSEQACCTTVTAVAGGEADDHAAGCCSSPTDFWIHVGLLAAVAPLGLIAWGAGYRRHRVGGVLWLGMAGVALLCGALLFGTQLFGGRGEQMMTVAGSICMVSAHLWNRTSQK
jgi:hypothetical protein